MSESIKRDKKTERCYFYTPYCLDCKNMVTKYSRVDGLSVECIYGRKKPKTLLDRIKDTLFSKE